MIVLAIYLIVVGLVTLLNVAIPVWVTGLLALVAGIILLVTSGLPYIRKV